MRPTAVASSLGLVPQNRSSRVVLPPPASAVTRTSRPWPATAPSKASSSAASASPRSSKSVTSSWGSAVTPTWWSVLRLASSAIATSGADEQREPRRLGDRFAACAHAELAQDRGDVMVDRPRREEEPFRYVGVSEAFGDELEDLALARGQTGGVRLRRGSAGLARSCRRRVRGGVSSRWLQPGARRVG